MPTMVISTELLAGKVGTAPATELPDTVMLVGQIALPVALPQVAEIPVTVAGTISAKVVLSAELGPPFVMVKT